MKPQRNYKYHYVYRITNIITNMHYYGDRSCNCHPSEDIGIKYYSSFTNRLFKQDQKENPQDYKYKIIKIFETCREDAKQLEVDLHKKFDVKNHPKFINRANQTSSHFVGGSNSMWVKKALETKKKVGADGLTGFKRIGNKISETKKSTIWKDTIGKKLSLNQSIKMNTEEWKSTVGVLANKKRKNTCNNNKWKSTIGKIKINKCIETKNKIGIDGLTTNQRATNKRNKTINSDDWAKKRIDTNNKMSKTRIENKLSIGCNNPNAKHINIYNANDIIIYETFGTFKSICMTYSLPYNALIESSNNNGKPIFSSIYKPAIARLIKNGDIIYKGWYAKVIND